MRTVTVEDNKIVVEVDGARVRYSLEIVRKRINSLLQDLEEWRNYERHLTQRASDGLESPAKNQLSTAEVKPSVKKRKVTSRA
jgi:hypothetical protein